MNANDAFARSVVDELARSGVQDLCVCPGSRSTPLVLAAHARRGLRITVHVDERSAGYFALGAARATGRPVAILVTSGTAGANLLPAVVEASQSRVPLVVLTADRPPELQDVGANQTIPQTSLFGVFPRWTVHVPPPEPDVLRLRHLRALVARSVARSLGPVPGPVHLNLAFREPFDAPAAQTWTPADAEAANGRPDDQPFLRVHQAARQPDPAAVEEVARLAASAQRGLIVAGPHAGAAPLPPSVVELGQRLGFPVVADALSGLRFGPTGADVVSAHDVLLADDRTRAALRPDLVLRFGGAPTSKNLLRLLHEAGAATQVLVDDGDAWGEETARARTVVAAAPAAVADALLAVLPPTLPASPWLRRWRDLDRRAWAAIEAELPHRAFEGALAARLVRSLADNDILYVGNSLPVRDVERFARATTKRLRVMANRGASGIDGVTSSAFGAAYASGRPVTLLLGDLSALHDLNAFLLRRRLGIPLRVVVVNNDGGGIFEFLHVRARDPPFTELFAAPHGLTFADLARAVGMPYRRMSIEEAVAAEWPSSPESPLTEVAAERAANVRHRKELEAVVQRAVEPVLHEVSHAD